MFGKNGDWHHFTGAQQKERLPDDWDASKHNVSIFLSSEDEFVAIGDQWKMPLYKDQVEGLRQIKTSILPRLGNQVRIYVRVHPNSKNTGKKFLEGLQSLHAPGFAIIPSDSPVSTYKLMMESSKVVSFGSTMGIESTYWGKPSICLGKSFYINLGVTHNPISHDDVLDLLLDTQVLAKSNDAMLKYGYYWKTFGIPYQHFKDNGWSGGQFKSANLESISYLQVQQHEAASWQTISDSPAPLWLRMGRKFIPKPMKYMLRNLIKN
jgi:hypothetical protein